MLAEKLSKIVMAVLISFLGSAAIPAAALAGPAKSSLSLPGKGSMCRSIPGAPLSRSLALSTKAGRGQLRRISAGSTLPKIPMTQIVRHGRNDLLASKGLRDSLACLPRSTSSSHKVSPPSKRSAPNKLTDRIVTQARHYLGTPYRSGGSLETGRATDCSGFVQYIYHQANIDLPRSSSEQAQAGKVVTRTLNFARLLPGDLLFFGQGDRRIGHVGIYLGDGKMIHCASRRGVIISGLDDPYHEGTFVVAKRLPEVQSPK
jgi:cell wall-associated NlpC family hydrolase